jgi:hypothetical protein
MIGCPAALRAAVRIYTVACDRSDDAFAPRPKTFCIATKFGSNFAMRKRRIPVSDDRNNTGASRITSTIYPDEPARPRA